MVSTATFRVSPLGSQASNVDGLSLGGEGCLFKGL
jgi:hypothetical protein